MNNYAILMILDLQTWYINAKQENKMNVSVVRFSVHSTSKYRVLKYYI